MSEAEASAGTPEATSEMNRACGKFLHITYDADNTWGYPLWNAINAVVSQTATGQLPGELKREIGDLVLAVSVRLDYLPSIINRINDSVNRLYDEMRQRDRTLDGYAYEPKSGVKYPLLVDINSFLFEIYFKIAECRTPLGCG